VGEEQVNVGEWVRTGVRALGALVCHALQKATEKDFESFHHTEMINEVRLT
jgi:hypothetical protein